MDDGEEQLFIVSSDFCSISPSVYDELTEVLGRDHDIPRESVWWMLTHTHSAPEVGPPGMAGAFLGERFKHSIDGAYTEQVKKAFIDGILLARERLEPARLGVGWGHSRANINRRARRPDGSVRLGMNPLGPVDRMIGIMRIDNLDGTPLAVIANYAIHGTALGQESTQISGDVPGVVAEYVEAHIEAPMLFVNGAAGDIAPIYSVYPNPQVAHLDEFQVLLGDPIVEAVKRTQATRSEVRMRITERIVETPSRLGLEWPASLSAYRRMASDGRLMARLPVRFVSIDDDILLWGAPVELFSSIAIEARERSAFPYTFYFGYANGWLGYLLTESEMAAGGYEARVSPFTASAERDLLRVVAGQLGAGE